MEFENYDLKLHGVRLPIVELTKKDLDFVGAKEGISKPDYLRLLSLKGLEIRIESGMVDAARKEEYITRLDRELGVINSGGFADYMLLVYDIIRFARENNIPKGAARGSAAGCLVLFLAQVTEVDPIIQELYFERFLSQARIKISIIDGITYVDGSLVPDVDLDISHQDRDKVIQYLFEKYPGKSCKLSTLSTLTSKILIKECGKIVEEYSEQQMNEVSAMIPSVFGKVRELEEAQEESKDFKIFCNDNPRIFKIARKLRGLIRNKGSHASGYLISFYPLERYLPMDLGSNGEIVSCYDMNDAQKVSIKVDLLGLHDVTLIDNVCKSAGIKVEDIDYNDPKLYEKLQMLEVPYGLFQIGGDCNLRVINKVKPRNLYDLAVVVALARPGALAYVDQFAEYVRTGEAQSVHPFFDDILEKTGGIPVFQEQAMKMVNKIGLTLDDAETIRRVIGKKKIDQMPVWEAKVRQAVKDNGIDPKAADVLWKVLDDSKSYSFNLSHSISYALLAAYSVYLKFEYPAKFFIESLKLTRAKSDPIAEIADIQKELVYFGVKLQPPDIVKSDLDFKEEGEDIRYGLSAIKGVSEKTFEKLKEFIDADKTNKFQIFQAAKRAKLNIGIFSALIQAGALSSMGDDRPKLVYEAQLFNLLTDKEKNWVIENGANYNYNLFSILKGWEGCISNGKPVFKESRIATLKKKADKYREIHTQNSKFPEFAAYVYERNLTGYCYSQKLKKIFDSYAKDSITTMLDIKSLMADDKAECVGFVTLCEKKTSKNKKKYCKIELEDETGKTELLLFDPSFSKFEEQGLIPKEGAVLLAGVRKWNDALIVDSIKLFHDKIYMKLADLKDRSKDDSEV